MESYLIAMLTFACLYGLLAVSLNLSWGLTGMVNLGLAGFACIGAYGSALLTTAVQWPVLAGVAVAIVAGVASGLALGAVTLRLRDDYLAIVTLGFAEVVRLAVTNELWLTHGSDGISAIPGPLPRELGQGFALGFLALAALNLLLVWWAAERIRTSPFGRCLRAIRDDPEGTAVAGKRVAGMKLKLFAMSTGVAALAGALYGHYTSFVSPDIFQPLFTIYVFLALTMGGTGNMRGAVLGAFLLIFILEGSRFAAPLLPELSAVQHAAIREMAVALVFVLVLLYRPQGILPEPRARV